MPAFEHSDELKARALYNVASGMREERAAKIFGVGVRSLRRWKANLLRYHSVSRPRVPRGPEIKLSEAQYRALIRYARQEVDLRVWELCDWCFTQFGVIVSIPTMYRYLERANLTRKVIRKVATNKDPVLCSAFAEYEQPYMPGRQCVWVDESSKDDRTLFRHYGWAPRGQRAVHRVPFGRGQRYSVLPAMTIDAGYIAMRVVRGSVKALEFIDFILNDVLPQMNPYPGDRSVLVMDNCKIHKAAALRRAVEAAGCRLVFIPPYSPEFNPIEESFSCFKDYLRTHNRRLQRSNTPVYDLLEAAAIITPDKARAWAKHSGYPVD